MFPLIPPFVALLALVATGAAGLYLLGRLRSHGTIAHGTLTPERQVIYEMAVEYLRNPESLRKLADEYDRQGIKPVAERLRKRAEVQELPAEQKLARREAYKKALTSTNVDAILNLAQVFDDSGSPGAAYNLRGRAQGISAALKAGQTPVASADNGTFLGNNGFAGEPRSDRDPAFGGRKGKHRGRGRGRPDASRAAPPPPAPTPAYEEQENFEPQEQQEPQRTASAAAPPAPPPPPAREATT